MLARILKKSFGSIPLHSKVVIIGAGDAGSATAKLLKTYSQLQSWNIRVIDPSPTYSYQSLQTAVGAGFLSLRFLRMPNRFLFPRGTVRIQAKVTSVDPDNNLVFCDDGQAYSYEALVVASGIDLRPDLVKGLQEALEDPACPVGSVYIAKYAEKYSRLRAGFKGGNAIFTQPSGVIKCGGAPQKIMYLSCDHWQKQKVAHAPFFLTGGAKYFVNDFYEKALYGVAEGYKVQISLNADLVEIKPGQKIAVFRDMKTGELSERPFDIMHVTPPQRPPAFISGSKLAGAEGFVGVDKHTLQHKKYPNVFSLGDSAELPTSRTASTINESSFVAAKNLISFLGQMPLKEKYDGYTACPVFVGKRKLMLCEFGYDGKVMPTFVSDQRKPRFLFYVLKMFVIPPVYVTFGPNAIRIVRHWVLCFRKYASDLKKNVQSYVSPFSRK